jgi:PAS domain S-box-containing protein
MFDAAPRDPLLRLAAASRDPIGLADAALNVRWVNTAALRLAGLDPLPAECTTVTCALTAMVGRSGTWPPPRTADGTSSGWSTIARRLMATPDVPVRVAFARTDGAQAEFDCRAIAHGDDWLFVATPAIPQEQLDARMREAESRYRSLIEHVPGAFYRCDHDAEWTMRFISDAIEGLVGYPAADFIDNCVRTYTSVIHPEDRDRVDRTVDEGVAGHRSFELEYRVIHRDGRIRWVEETGAGIFDERGDLLYLDGFIRDITDSRDTRARLRDSEAVATEALRKAEAALAEIEAYRAALDQHAMVAVADSHGRVMSVNARFERTFGWHRDELVGQHYRVIDAGSVNEAPLRDMDAAVREGRIWHGQFQVKTRDGRRFWVSATVVPLTDSRTGELQEVAILEDITERRESERRILEERQRLQLALDGGDLGLWDWDMLTGRVDYDARWASMLGLDVTLLPSTYATWAERVHPDELPSAIQRIEACRRGETDRYEWTGRMLHVDGTWRWVMARGRVVGRDEQGNPARLVGTHADVSARVEAERALTEQVAKLEAAERQTRMGHWSWDACTGNITWSNNLFDLHGRSRDAGMPSYGDMLSCFDEPSRIELAAVVRQSIERGESYRIRLRSAPPVDRWIECDAHVVTDAEGRPTGLVGTCIDVSERVASEQALQAALLRVEAATRAKTEFLANMSHEIRSPLNAILGYAEILRDEYAQHGPDGHALQAVETIIVAGRHLLTIINDILDISKIEAGRMTLEDVAIDVRDLFRDVLSLMLPRAREKRLQLSIKAETTLPREILGDPKRLRQILMNLVGNAVKFTESGDILVNVRAEPEEEPNWLVVDVADTGVGMSGDVAGSLFKPFSQLDSSASRRHEGTGLGLNICRRLAEMMGGHVRLLWSEAGRGSCFRLELPLRVPAGSRILVGPDCLAPDGTRPTDRPLPTNQESLSGRILLVDDGDLNLRLFKFHLERAGAEVTTADNGLTALGAVRDAVSQQRPFDLIVTDIQMPDMDGYEMTRTLRNDGCAVPIIALTAHAMAEDRRRCLESGCDDYISKPVDRESLVSRCRAWLGRRSQRVVTPDAAA